MTMENKEKDCGALVENDGQLNELDLTHTSPKTATACSSFGR